jgi:GDP-D-mannose 3', 5'-epimerase
MNNIWSDRNVLICGGAGFIGSHLARKLAEDNASVTIADNLSSGSGKNLEGVKCRFFKKDLRDISSCSELIENQDYVFQLAANMGGIEYITKIGADIMHDNAQINLNMLKACLNSRVKGYFYSSSACVYPQFRQGKTRVTGLKESDVLPADPDLFYGWEKLFTEQLIAAYQKDHAVNINIARFHNVFGPGYTVFDKDRGKAPCHIIMKVLDCPDGGEIELWGDGKQTRSFLYIDDCIEGILRIAESGYPKPLNIGSDRLVSIEQLAQMVIKISGKTIKIRHDLNKPQGVRGRNADIALARKILRWEPSISLEEGLSRTYAWARQHFNDLEL